MANLYISPEVIREAEEVGIQVSSFCESQLRDETQQRRAEQWNKQNSAFLDEYCKLIEKNGLTLDEFRTF